MSGVLSQRHMDLLVEDIEAIYLQAQRDLRETANKILLKAYWDIGCRIVNEEQARHVRAQYGSKLLAQLSERLTERRGKGFSQRNLYNMRNVYLCFPILQPVAKLEWTHYCLLSTIKDEKKRDFYRKKTQKEGWSKSELKKALYADNVECESLDSENNSHEIPQDVDESALIIAKLPMKRERLYTYTVSKTQAIERKEDAILLDCGFGQNIRVPWAGKSKPAADVVLESEKVNGQYRFKTSSVTRRPYMYRVYLERIVDGDTLVCDVDCGFNVFLKQRFRLAHINTPEIDTPEGQASLDFVQTTLAFLHWVVIRSVGKDKYGRWLAEVYYSEDLFKPQEVADKGLYLNQEIVDQGFGEVLTMAH